MICLSVSRPPARLAFIHFLRTGWRFPESAFHGAAGPIETKFNPNHDPQNGQFTSGPEGGGVSDGVYRPDRTAASWLLTSAEEEPRGIGDNGGPPLDPLVIEQVFPGVSHAPAGAVIAALDPVLDLTGPSGQMTNSMSLAYTNNLINQIKAVDPSYHFDTFGLPSTLEGQMRQINDLRWDRAAVIYRATGNAEPLQVETLRFLQDRADAEYDNALAAAKVGDLPPAPTERMAIGNYIDKAVKKDLRDVLSIRNLSAPVGDAVRVSGREYDSSGDDLTYSVPDARVKNIAFDVTIAPKGPQTRQIRQFFKSDFRPDSVIIVRPRQLGANNTYIITRSGK